MERMIQLRESEYEQLMKTYQLKNNEISEKAVQIWKEKGVAEIKVIIDASKEFDGVFTIACDSYIYEKDERFVLPKELRDRFCKMLDREVKWLLDRYYGDAIKVVNTYNKKEQSLNKWFRLAWLIAVSGWVVASMLLLN